MSTIQLEEFGAKILNHAFIFNDKPFYCHKAEVKNQKLLVFTKSRTFVLLPSELSKITILHDSKMSTLIKKEKNEMSTKRHKTSTYLTLTDERLKEIKDKYFPLNFGKTYIPFSPEEDELILNVRLSILQHYIGRSYASINTRKHNLTKSLNDHIKPVQRFSNELDCAIMTKTNSELAILYPDYTTLQFSSRRATLVRQELRMKHRTLHSI